MNTADPPRWNLNSSIGALCSIWVHLAMFCYYTKLGAKWVEQVQLMHKFVPWSRFAIFRNQCTRPTPLDPKLMFVCSCSVWEHLAMFCYYTKLGAKRVELVQLKQKFVPWNRIGIFRNERSRSTPLDPNSCLCASHSVWVHLEYFVTTRNSVQNGLNWCN